MEHPLALGAQETIEEDDIDKPIVDLTSKNPAYEPPVKIQDPDYYAGNPVPAAVKKKKSSSLPSSSTNSPRW